MTGRADWQALRDRRLEEPGGVEAYEATRLAYELGRAVRGLREQHDWSLAQLARAAGMTQSAVARFEAGGVCRHSRSLSGSLERSTSNSL